MRRRRVGRRTGYSRPRGSTAVPHVARRGSYPDQAAAKDVRPKALRRKSAGAERIAMEKTTLRRTGVGGRAGDYDDNRLLASHLLSCRRRMASARMARARLAAAPSSMVCASQRVPDDEPLAAGEKSVCRGRRPWRLCGPVSQASASVSSACRSSGGGPLRCKRSYGRH